ncbi:uncharacterized protein CANTADRAFT_37904, partial [Suhomyces tanzawaensis NRRL Y-17324]
KSFLNNINYVTHNDHYLNETENFSLSPRYVDGAYQDYVSLYPDIIPGYTLLKQFNSTFEKADIVYHAVTTNDGVNTSTNVAIRLSPNILKNVPLSRFLNEWYILSGLNVPHRHRIFGNEAISNKYFESGPKSKVDYSRPDIYHPITLPRDLPGILYPVKVLTLNSQREQCRLALIYLDNNYRSLRDFAFEEQEEVYDLNNNLDSAASMSSASSMSNNVFGSMNGYSGQGVGGVTSSGFGGSVNMGNLLFDEIANKIKQTPKSPLKVIEILSDMIKVLDTLAIVHEFGVVHNNITSINILKSETDNTDVKLSGWDFCFTIQPEDSTFDYRKRHLTQLPELLPYLSPELCGEANRGVDYRSDFYSVGIVLYELLVGCTPFFSDSPSKIIRRHILQKPVAPSLIAHAWITDDLSDIIMKLLEKDPDNRYSDCHSLINDLIQSKNEYIDTVTNLGDSVVRYWTKREDTKGYLVKETTRNLEKCGVAPIFLYPRGVYGRDEQYKKIFEKYENLSTGVNMLFITGEMGSGKTTLINDIRSSTISTNDFYFHWKFDSSETSVTIYTCFLHGIKVIVNQIMSSSQEIIHRWRDLIITKIQVDLRVLFLVIPELKVFLGPAYDTLVESDPRFQSTSQDHLVNLELKFRYIIKAFFCLIGFQGLTMFLDDIQWCSLSEWAMFGEIFDYFQSNELENEISIKMVAAYTDNACENHKEYDQQIKESKEKSKNGIDYFLLKFLGASSVHNHVFELKRLESNGFLDYINAGFSYIRDGSILARNEQTSMSSMFGSLQLSINQIDDSTKFVASKIFEISKGNVLLARYLIASSLLNGEIQFGESRINSGSKWVIDLEKHQFRTGTDIMNHFLKSALTDKARDILNFAAVNSDGYYFHLSQLMIVSNLSLKEVYELLHLCVETGVIIPTSYYHKIPFHLITSDAFPFDISDSSIWELAGQTRYKFYHDSIRYQFINEMNDNDELEEYHRLSALRSYKRISKQAEFSISNYLKMANHFSSSCGVARVEDIEIYKKVLIQAGRYASSTYNSKAALKYFEAADTFIDKNDTKTKLKSVITICQSQQLLKRYDECLKYIEDVQSQFDFDETVFLLAKVKCYIQSGSYEEGVKTAVKGLQKIGIDVYYDNEKSRKLYHKIIDKVPISIPEIRELKASKKATSPIILLVYELISDIIVPCYTTKFNYLAKYLVAQLVTLIKSYGVSTFCSIPLLDFANSFISKKDKAYYMKGLEFCKIALDIVKSTENVSSELIKNTYEFYILTVAVYIEPIPQVLKYYDIYIRSKRPFVRSHSASMNFLTEASKYLLFQLSGYPFDSIISSKVSDQLDFSTSNGSHLYGYSLLHGDISLEEFEAKYPLDGNPRHNTFLFHVSKMAYLNTCDRFNEVRDMILSGVHELLEYLPLGLVHIGYSYHCIISLTKCDFTDQEQRVRANKIVEESLALFQLWSELCPSTYESKYRTLRALHDKYNENISPLIILDAFDEAIDLGRNNNNWYDVGMASYFCANWLSKKGHGTKRVIHYAKTALEVFKILDDRLLVAMIQKKFGTSMEDGYNWAGLKVPDRLLQGIKPYSFPEMSESLTTVKSKFQVQPAVAPKSNRRDKTQKQHKIFSKGDSSTDFNKAVKSCLLISESSTDTMIVLKLLESTIMFMDVDYGVTVIREDNDEPHIRAIGSANTVYNVDNQPLSSRGDICPFSLLMHVLHTGEIVNKDEDHVMFSNRFGKDDYYQRNNCTSMICIPLKNQSGVFGALYLENQKPLIKKGMPFFDAKKKDLLDLLCSQAAVSLSKAKLYSQMEIAKSAAEDATAEKASFLANMSHEIRTPFNSLLSCSIFLLDTELTKTQREYVETIRSSAMVTLNIIDGILAFSKIEHGSFTLDNAPFSLCDCIESSMQLSGEQAAVNDLELVFLNRSQNIKSIIGDVTRFRQIIINLVGNAIKFTSAGSIIVEATAREISPDRVELCIYVKDSGIGIPEESRNKVFGAFSQVDGSSRREFGGSGLGLAISKKLSDIMGGDLGFHSSEGVGSTFYFIVNSQVEFHEKPEIYFGTEIAKSLGVTNQVLIIDDHINGRMSLKETLEYFGLEVTTINNLTEIRQNIDEFSFIFIHESHYDNFKKYQSVIHDKCKIVVLALFGKSLPKDIEDHSVLLSPFQRLKLINIIESTINGERKTDTSLKVANHTLLAERFPLRILLAEDNVVNTKVALQHLKKFGYHADHAKDGVEVISRCEALLAESKFYDVILMDIQMPRKDGINATIELNESFTAKGKEDYIPKIVALTANVAGDDRERSLSCGMVDFISKPVVPSELERVLTSLGKQI